MGQTILEEVDDQLGLAYQGSKARPYRWIGDLTTSGVLLPDVARVWGALRRGAYEIFMNRSGLPDGHFVMLILGSLDGSVSLIRQIAESGTVGRFVLCRP